MIVLGVDGGISGAAAKLDTELGLLEVVDIPFIERRLADGRIRHDLDTAMWRSLLTTWWPKRIFFEAGREIPRVGNDGRRQHQSGMYQYGYVNGRMVGVAVGMGILYTLVEPDQWKRAMGLTGKDKQASRAKATELLGKGLWWPNKGHHNRAEAALIALYGANGLSALRGANGLKDA